MHLDVSPWTKSWSSRWKQKHSLDHHYQLRRLYCSKNLAVAGQVETLGTMRICQCCNNNLGPKWSVWSRCFTFNSLQCLSWDWSASRGFNCLDWTVTLDPLQLDLPLLLLIPYHQHHPKHTTRVSVFVLCC